MNKTGETNHGKHGHNNVDLEQTTSKIEGLFINQNSDKTKQLVFYHFE